MLLRAKGTTDPVKMFLCSKDYSFAMACLDCL